MQTVESIVKSVYKTDLAAASRLGLRSRSAVSNWKKWGYFPRRLLPDILADAKKAGVKLAIGDIPIPARLAAAE